MFGEAPSLRQEVRVGRLMFHPFSTYLGKFVRFSESRERSVEKSGEKYYYNCGILRYGIRNNLKSKLAKSNTDFNGITATTTKKSR
jgi:hypothetical protein